MNFTTLKYFLTAAEELNITRAAARLFISQQALSSHIGKLEAELGVKLFDRLPSLTLTYAGRRMVEYAQQAVNLERQIHQMAGDVNNDQVGELRVGISHTCGRAILPSILPRFRQTHPLVDIKLVEDNSAEMEKELRQGDLDLMIDFLPKPQEGLVHEELITSACSWSCRRSCWNPATGPVWNRSRANATAISICSCLRSSPLFS
ncbi:MAG: LysR family transcriptional regulator [Firmicutes bacterium]|nr:LysR family transcriptional regulator [Bacillota bacterium]